MKIGTLFSGIGSPEQGASRVYDDLDLTFACEWDKYARESFKANYEIEDQHFHKDISDMDGTQYKDKIDIIIGGSPCQDFSIAGLRAGVEGNKGVLIYEYIRIIEEVSPPIFIYENVKGMLSDKGGRTIKEFVEAFREMGYFCHYEVLNTKDYGVPQNRERIFLVGFKCHEHYYNFSFASKQKLETRLKDLLEDEVEEKYYLNNKAMEYMDKERNGKSRWEYHANYKDGEASCLTANMYKGIPYGVIQETKEPQLKQVGILDIKGNDSIKRVYAADGISPTLTTMGGGNREPKIQVPSATSKGYEEASEGDSINLTHPRSTTRRGRVGKQVAQTLDCACNQAVVELWKIRKLTPRECFRLQDFPDSFKFVVSNSQLYKQAGNSISANVMEMIFKQIEKSRSGNTNQGSLF